MITLLLLTIYAAFHFYLLGGTWGRRLMMDRLEGPDLLLLGLMMHYVILATVNVFMPIGLWTTMALTGLVLLTAPARCLELCRSVWIHRGAMPLLLFLFMLMMPYWSVPEFLYDHYLYHDQTVKWFHQYSLPAGLTNLHGRLGFNNATFPIASSFQTGLNSHWYFINAGLFTLFMFKSIRLLIRADTKRWLRVSVIMLTGTVCVYAHPYLSGISPDLQISLLTGYLLITLAADDWRIKEPGFILSLLAFMVVTKVNVGVFAASMVLVILWKQRNQPGFLRMLILPVCIGMVWVLRSLIMSGQILYPFPGLYLQIFEHSVPFAHVADMKDLIVAWGRSPGPGSLERYRAMADGFAWVHDWYTNQADHAYTHLPGDVRISRQVWFWLVLAVGCWSIAALILRRKGLGVAGLLIFALMANVVFWFLTGPDFRFAAPIFHAIFFVVMVSGAGGAVVRWIACLFLLVTLPFQLKDVGREYSSHLRRLPEAYLWKGCPDTAVGTYEMIEGWIPAADGSDSFRYVYPREGDRARLDVFPAAPGKVEGLVFERRGGRLVFRVIK